MSKVPTLDQIGTLARTRTRVNPTGVESGTFSEDTSPTADQVNALIAAAAGDVYNVVGNDTPSVMDDEIARLTAWRTVMLLELSYFPEQVARGTSPYEQYKKLYDEQLPIVRVLVEEAEVDSGLVDTSVSAGMPSFQRNDRPSIGTARW